MDSCFALMWAHQHGRAGCLSILVPRAATLLASTTVRDLWLVLEQYVCDSLTSGISTQPQKLDSVPVTNSYKTWQLLLRVILEQERIKVLYPVLLGTLWSPRYHSSGNQIAATVATDPISYLESSGFLLSEPTAGTTAARRR